MKKLVMAVLVGLLAFALSGCFESTKEQKVKAIVLSSTATSGVKVGDSMILTVSVTDEDGKVMEGQTPVFYSAKKVGTDYPTAVVIGSNVFKPTEAADYKLYAKIGDVKSNEILVTVAAGSVTVDPQVRLFNEGSPTTKPKVIITLSGAATAYTFDLTDGTQYSAYQSIKAGTYKVTWQAISSTTGVLATNDANLVNGNTDPTVYGYVAPVTLTFANNTKYKITYPTTGNVGDKVFVATAE